MKVCIAEGCSCRSNKKKVWIDTLFIGFLYQGRSETRKTPQDLNSTLLQEMR